LSYNIGKYKPIKLNKDESPNNIFKHEKVSERKRLEIFESKVINNGKNLNSDMKKQIDTIEQENNSKITKYDKMMREDKNNKETNKSKRRKLDFNYLGNEKYETYNNSQDLLKTE